MTWLRIAALLACLAWAQTSAAQPASEWRVKAVFLTRFAAFATWPSQAFADPQEPFSVCVMDGAPFYGEVQRAARGAHVGGRPIAVRLTPRTDTFSACHIVYVGQTAGASPEEALARALESQALTVTDARNGTQRGAIHFVTIENRVRFHVDLRLVQSRGISLNPRLLALAVSVQEAR